MILAIASGKGGTGKTTVSVNLARVFGPAVRLLDCDVEEPNDHLFLKGAPRGEETVTIPVPQVDESLCDGCGECGRFCEYHAIVSFGATAILDAPPGTSCPVIATLRGADFVMLVTEPTPFGLHDLDLAVDMVRELCIPFGVVVNRVGIGDDRVHVFCKNKGIPMLLEIPDDRRIAEAYSRGELVVEALPEYLAHFERLREAVRERTSTDLHDPAGIATRVDRK